MLKMFSILLLSAVLTQNIDGFLIDRDSGNPISDVQIILLPNYDKIAQSNLDGQFSFSYSNELDSIKFIHISYKDKVLPVSQITNKVYLDKDMLFADVVEITSSRKETRVSDSPTLTYVISEKELESTASIDFYQSLQTIIPNVMFSPDYHGTNLKIQGLDSEYILILVDGDRIAGNTVGNIDFSRFDSNQIQRIEILKGNASTLYGSNAIGGVINIITKPNQSNKNKFNLNLKYADFNTINNSISFNTFIKDISSKSNILFKSSDGYNFESIDSLSLRKRSFKDYNIAQSFKYNKEDFMVELSGNYYRHDWFRFLTQEPFIMPEQNDRKRYESFSIKLKEKNHLSSINGHYNFSYTYDQYNKYHVIDSNYDSSEDDIFYDWTKHSVEQISSLLYLFKDNLNSTLGIDIINEKGESFDIIVDNVVLLESELGDLNSKRFSSYALFVQSQYTVNKYLNLFIGSRYTGHNQFKNRLTSQLTSKYSINNNHFRINVGQGYRVPNIYELYYDWNHYDSFEVRGNPNLEPENSLNYSFSFQKLDHTWNFMIIFQRNLIENMIAEKRFENGDFYYENYSKTSVNSFETNFSTSINGFDFELNYNFSRVIDEIEYLRLPDISEHTINLILSKSFKNNISFLSTFNFYDEKTIIAPTSGQETYIPYFFQTNLSIVKNSFNTSSFLKNVKLKLAINNLFNYTNFEDSTFQNPGRTFFVEIGYNYGY
ncbi:MAG: hypothetical protein CBE33_04655 [Candidatus Pelagibacter sp. TMED273]|nr:MAG: hypothetical protein CBE33_04655 [Candidatus Pelagibacter sp. TMED273]